MKECSNKNQEDPYECVDSCDSTYYENGKNCVKKCPKDKLTIETTKKCVSSCDEDPNNQYLIKLEKECVPSCPPLSYPLLVPSNPPECSSFCPDTYPYINLDNTQCVSQCEGLVDVAQGKCVTNCDLKFQYKNECVTQCPRDTMLFNGQCKIDLKLTQIDDSSSFINIDLEDAIDFIGDNVIDYVDIAQTIKGDGFIVQIYPLDDPPLEDSSISSIDISQCELLLRREFDIPPSESLIIAKYDIINSTALINQVEYKVYRSDGTELPLTLCNSVNVDISYPLNSEFKDEIDFLSAQKYNEEGIDVFNSNDPFFSDPCYVYQINGSDVVLSDRREEIYQNVTLCENNCRYDGIDYAKKRIQCACETKEEIKLIKDDYKELQNNNMKFMNEIVSTNLYLSKCYNVFISCSNWVFNIGFWFMLAVIVLQWVTVIVLIATNLNTLYSAMNKYQRSNPPSEDFFEKYLFKSPKLIDDDSYDKLKKSTENNKIEKENFIIDELYIRQPIDIDNYPFHLAINADRRNCFVIFIKILKEKYIFFRAIFTKSKYELISLNLSMCFFYMGVVFSLNAIFYNDDSISERYHNNGKLSLLANALRSLYSFLLSFVLLKIASFLKYYAPLFDVFVIEINCSDTLGKYFNKGIYIVKRKLVIFYIVVILVSLFFWYYLTIFCYVYNSVQVSWFTGGWISMAMSLMIVILYAMIYAILKVIAVRCKNRKLYNFLLYANYIY